MNRILPSLNRRTENYHPGLKKLGAMIISELRKMSGRRSAEPEFSKNTDLTELANNKFYQYFKANVIFFH